MTTPTSATNNVTLYALTAVVGVVALVVIKKLLGGSKRPKALDTERYIAFALRERIVVSHDTRIFRFALEHPEQVLGLPIGQHMALKVHLNGKDVVRMYTPISSDEDLGRFDLMVKVYFAGVHPKFPDGGVMSQHLEKMKIGETIDVQGPKGRFEYLGKGQYQVKVGKEWKPRSVRRIGMIAGGTGITPMLQVVRAILKDKSDTTQVSLLFANQTEADILLRQELEECAKDKRFQLWYTLDRPEEGWKYSKGFIDLDMVTQRLPKPDGGETEAIVLMCGPPPMIQFACKPNLEKAGFTADQMFTF